MNPSSNFFSIGNIIAAFKISCQKTFTPLIKNDETFNLAKFYHKIFRAANQKASLSIALNFNRNFRADNQKASLSIALNLTRIFRAANQKASLSIALNLTRNFRAANQKASLSIALNLSKNIRAANQKASLSIALNLNRNFRAANQFSKCISRACSCNFAILSSVAGCVENKFFSIFVEPSSGLIMNICAVEVDAWSSVFRCA